MQTPERQKRKKIIPVGLKYIQWIVGPIQKHMHQMN
jgi:hypothetical protein